MVPLIMKGSQLRRLPQTNGNDAIFAGDFSEPSLNDGRQSGNQVRTGLRPISLCTVSGGTFACLGIMYSQHVERDGKSLFQEVSERNPEGIVCKRKSGVYSEHGWLKIKNPNYSRTEG
jgi:hypothetical protein